MKGVKKMALPQFTPEQRAEALKKAAIARKARAELKLAVKAGKKSVADVVKAAKTDRIAAKTKVLAILRSVPGIGVETAKKIMSEVGIHETRRVGGLGSAQAKGLLAHPKVK
jgi:transposase